MDRWGGPLNGQRYRQGIFRDLVNAVAPEALIETGTFRGTTTLFMAGFGLPVYTVETNPRHFAYSSLRFRFAGVRVHQHLGDSRHFLRTLETSGELATTKPLLYLDAHWEEDLPLLEEVEIIFGAWPRAVVMVDDFQVPGTDYGYDSYGPGRVLNLAYLQQLSSVQLTAFFPAVGPAEETGAKKGCVVLCGDHQVAATISQLSCLRRHTAGAGHHAVEAGRHAAGAPCCRS